MITAGVDESALPDHKNTKINAPSLSYLNETIHHVKLSQMCEQLKLKLLKQWRNGQQQPHWISNFREDWLHFWFYISQQFFDLLAKPPIHSSYLATAIVLCFASATRHFSRQSFMIKWLYQSTNQKARYSKQILMP